MRPNALQEYLQIKASQSEEKLRQRRESKKNMRKPGFSLHGEEEYKKFQDLILSEKGVECSVVITAHTISIRTESYSDYILARSVVKPRTSLEIVRG